MRIIQLVVEETGLYFALIQALAHVTDEQIREPQMHSVSQPSYQHSRFRPIGF